MKGRKKALLESTFTPYTSCFVIKMCKNSHLKYLPSTYTKVQYGIHSSLNCNFLPFQFIVKNQQNWFKNVTPCITTMWVIKFCIFTQMKRAESYNEWVQMSNKGFQASSLL